MRVPSSRALEFASALALSGAVASPPATAFANEGFWQPIATDHAPAFMAEHAVAYDATRNRLLAYSGFPNNDSRFEDVWALDLAGPARWTRIAPTGPLPGTGYRTSLVYDPVGDRLILYGGTVAAAGSDLWQLNLTGPPEWSRITASGSMPPARKAHVAVYDPAGHRMVVFGGSAAASGAPLGDVWSLDLNGTPAWSAITAVGGPAPREWAQGVYDAANQRLVVQGGLDAAGVRSDLWSLSLSGAPVWTQLSIAGPDRFGAAAVYDPAHQRMLVFGGIAAVTSCGPGLCWPYQQTVHAYALIPGGSWSVVNPGSGAGPGNRAVLGGVLDAAGRFVIFGGLDESGGDEHNDAWVVPATTGAPWQQLRPNLPRVDERRDAALVWDPLRRRALLYGGWRDYDVSDQTWILGDSSPEWEVLPVTVAGNLNRTRAGASVVWDAPRDRMLVFGGQTSFGQNILNSVIALSGGSSVWSTVSTNPGPSPRMQAAAAHDPVRDRVLYFAGYPAYNARNQTWALALGGNGPTWTQLAPTGTPPAQRWGHTMTYDPVRDRMIVFGGGDGVASNTLHALSLAGGGAWSTLIGPGTPPPARSYHAAVYDPLADRLVVWGGRTSTGLELDDTWEYRFDGSGWRPLDLATRPPGRGTGAFYDPERHRMVIFGGIDGSGLRRDSWALNLDGQTTGVPEAAPRPGFSLAGAVPNPAFRAPRIALTLSDGAAATLELIDLTGRRVRSHEVGPLGAGRHVVEMGEGAALAPGLYFARLTRAGETLTAKVCIAR